MKKITVLTLMIMMSIGIVGWAEEKAGPKLPHSVLDVTPAEAYAMLEVDPEQTFLIDCRSMAEYELVGHPPMAYNIPYELWTPTGFNKNRHFVKDIMEKFNKSNRLIIMCGWGERSIKACEILKKFGFSHLYNVVGGFEGDEVKDKNSPNYGHRCLINGWQHDGLTYTYKLKEELKYKLHTSSGR